MALNKKILLARPHSFIVSEMRPFLEKGGFSPSKLECNGSPRPVDR